MNALVNIHLNTSVAIGLMGYLVVFLGLVLLMLVVMALGTIMRRRTAPKKRTSAEDMPTAAECIAAPITEGMFAERDEPELFDTDPRDAAMVMAIVAYRLGKPLEELHFKSIQEIR